MQTPVVDRRTLELLGRIARDPEALHKVLHGEGLPQFADDEGQRMRLQEIAQTIARLSDDERLALMSVLEADSHTVVNW